MVTPFAYTSPSPAKSVGHLQVSFHFLNAGPVVGNDSQISVTAGLFKVAEIGYSRAFSFQGTDAALSPLFTGGFNIFHGKVILVPENLHKMKFMPAIAVGFVARTQVQRGSAAVAVPKKSLNNEDVYLVATKTITQVKGLPFVLNAGVKGTNASLMGIAGNAGDVSGNPEWSARAFGAVAFVLPGPAHSKLIVGSEAAQQPKYLYQIPGPTIPTLLTYFVRVVPPSETHFNVDLAVAQVAGRVLANAIDLQARHQFGMGISYQF